MNVKHCKAIFEILWLQILFVVSVSDHDEKAKDEMKGVAEEDALRKLLTSDEDSDEDEEKKKEGEENSDADEKKEGEEGKKDDKDSKKSSGDNEKVKKKKKKVWTLNLLFWIGSLISYL